MARPLSKRPNFGREQRSLSVLLQTLEFERKDHEEWTDLASRLTQHLLIMLTVPQKLRSDEARRLKAEWIEWAAAHVVTPKDGAGASPKEEKTQ